MADARDQEIVELRAVIRRLVQEAPSGGGGHCGFCDGCPDGECNEGCATRDCPAYAALALLPPEENNET